MTMITLVKYELIQVSVRVCGEIKNRWKMFVKLSIKINHINN